MRITGTRIVFVTTMLLAVSGARADLAPLADKTDPYRANEPATLDAGTPAHFWALTGKPDLRSSSVVIFDEEAESILYSRDANRVRPIASITKLMTALVVREADQPLDEIIEITADDRDTERGTTSRLLIGTKLTRDDLLRLALMSSENRAAHALGRSYPGGLAEFVRAMNKKAKALEMKSARFTEPTGLSSGNVASANDLVKLVRAAAQDPLIREYSTLPNHIVEVGDDLLEFKNSNSLVTKDDWRIALQKTGYTSDAGRCLVMTAFVQERPVVMILLNSVGKYTRIADARRVRSWMEAGSTSERLASSPQPSFTPVSEKSEREAKAVAH